MKILVIGNGGREHALLQKIRSDAPDAELFVTKGNGGTAEVATSIPLGPTEIQALAGWALREGVDLTVVGPEIPLAEGVVDHFSAQNLAIFGPSKRAAEIESSKAFAKSLMQRHGIPTADFEIFTETGTAVEYVRTLGAPLVVKASGLAAGKGALVCESTDEAVAAVEDVLGEGVFGAAGEQLVIEEFMQGEELSVFALCGDDSLVTLLAAQDHKRIGEGDTGPNTGGMGAYAPVSIASPELLDRIEREILRPTVEALAEEGRPYRGVLYAGLMITDEGPKVVEFNCRFGDPEAQVILPLMESSLVDLMVTVASGTPLTDRLPIRWRPGAAVTTVLASGGYPGEYMKGVPIELPPDLTSEDVFVFHAGTAREGDRLVTSGGRVLSVTAIGATVGEAAERSRSVAERIRFEGRTFRRDIAWREVGRV
ncbi:MAG: phosphoribosylamine--glycine ligase [Gemmatimonadota bacterium]